MAVAQKGVDAISALEDLLDNVQGYPISNIDLVEQARSQGMPKETVEFLETVPASTLYQNREDVLKRFSQARILEQELEQALPESPAAGHLGENT